jgi:alanine racemase
LEVAARLSVETVVHNEEQLGLLERSKARQQFNVWLKIDTGMHRLGFEPKAVAGVYRRLCACESVAGTPRLMTHFAQAHEFNDEAVARQHSTFHEAVSELPGERSSANSATLIGWPQCHEDWVRPGLMLYGVSPFAERDASELGLSPVMALRSELIAVKKVAAGEGVGYGAEWRCPETMLVGVVAIGYGDGYPRHAASGTPVLVNGVRTGVVGVSSMDMLSVDLRSVPDAKVGDPVTLWGDGLAVEEVSSCAATAPYELLCNVRVRAEYVDAD